jgi:DMSO reductase family type II enzyme heme b subunit
MPGHTRLTLVLVTVALVVAVAAMLATALPTRASTPAQAADGKAIYTQRCEVCHGVNGDGNGPAADVLFPRPRDFTLGAFEIRTTPSDSPPTDDDLINVIGNGMPGSTMPAWKDVLSRDEIAAVAAYIKTFSDAFGDGAPQSIAVGNRVNADAESIARGAQAYQELQCFKCHGDEGRGDGPSALTLTDEAGQVIYPADLTQAWLFRGGGTADDIYRRIMTGMQGSPMPSFADALVDAEGNPNEQKRWDLVNYVDSLSPDTTPALPEALIGKLTEGSIPNDPNDPAWQAANAFYFPLVGQIMRQPRNFTPSITGVWVRALYNASELGLLVQWDDRHQSTESDVADRMVVQFPASLPEGVERPYFVFGDADHPVNLWIWSGGSNLANELTGRGLTESAFAEQANQHVAATGVYAAGRYSVVFRRALNTGDADDLTFAPGTFIPIAFAASDGWRGETLNAAAISAWHSFYLEQPAPATRYIWVPVAIVATVILEGLVMWLVRRNAV